MKKLFPYIFVACFVMLSSLTLFACNETKTYINLSFDDQSLYRIVLSSDGRTLTSDSFQYEIEPETNIRVEVYAAKAGLDFSNLVVSINGQNRNLTTNSDYSFYPEDENLYVGYILLPQVEENTDINFSGAKTAELSLTLKADDIEDEAVIEKLEMTSVSFGGEEDYVNLYDFLTSETSKTVTRQFETSEDFSTFKVKFDGGNPFDLNNVPFYLQSGSQQISLDAMTYSDGVYTASLGKLYVGQYGLVADFKDLAYQNFLFVFPQENMTYEVETDVNFLNYQTGGTLTISKTLPESADYTNLTVRLNQTVLEKSNETEQEVTFILPEKLTPYLAGGNNVYQVFVEGIEYNKDVFELTATLVGTDNAFIQPRFCAIDESGAELGAIGYLPNGVQISLQGQRNALIWQYKYNETANAYSSPFDLLDYDIVINKNSEEVINLKNLLSEQTENVTLQIGDMTLKATYNESSEAYDHFQLEFVCDRDLSFEFSNFKPFEKEIYLLYNLSDARVSAVEYAITDSENSQVTQWNNMINQVPTTAITVTSDSYVNFRLTSAAELAAHEFVVTNQSLYSSKTDITYSEGGNNYLILSYKISEFQFDGEDFVLTGAINVF